MWREGWKKSGMNNSLTRSLFYWSSPTSLIRRVWNQYNELCYLRTRRRAETSSFDSICQYLDEGSGARWYTRLAKSKRKRLWMLEDFLWRWMEEKKVNNVIKRHHWSRRLLEPRSAISFLQTWQNVLKSFGVLQYDCGINEINPCKQIIKSVYLHVRKAQFCVSSMT